jgi:hypothetical protein
MAATYVKFQDFAEQLGKKIHDLNADTLKVYLSNTAPNVATHVKKGDLAEITPANGYPSGGTDIQNTYTETSGTGTMVAVDVTFTASGGAFGPFRYSVVYNDTDVTFPDALVCYWDYGSSISCNDGESFKVDFGASVLVIGP